MTQAEFRKALKEKKLTELPLWFKTANGMLDLAGTNVGVAVSAMNVQVFSAIGRPIPPSFVTMLVFGAASLLGNVVAGILFLKEKFKEKKDGANPAIPLSSP